MVDALVDSTIVIDVLRNHQPALTWLQTQVQDLAVTRYVWLEVMEGCSNKQEQRVALRTLNKFEIVAITDKDTEWATNAFIQHFLKSNTGAFDCLIAAPAHRLQILLYTRNLKHFTPLLGNLAQNPY